MGKITHLKRLEQNEGFLLNNVLQVKIIDIEMSDNGNIVSLDYAYSETHLTDKESEELSTELINILIQEYNNYNNEVREKRTKEK